MVDAKYLTIIPKDISNTYFSANYGFFPISSSPRMPTEGQMITIHFFSVSLGID